MSNEDRISNLVWYLLSFKLSDVRDKSLLLQIPQDLGSFPQTIDTILSNQIHVLSNQKTILDSLILTPECNPGCTIAGKEYGFLRLLLTVFGLRGPFWLPNMDESPGGMCESSAPRMSCLVAMAVCIFSMSER